MPSAMPGILVISLLDPFLFSFLFLAHAFGRCGAESFISRMLQTSQLSIFFNFALLA
jgi:hypothetical protein